MQQRMPGLKVKKAFRLFHERTPRPAIAEGFILDVLQLALRRFLLGSVLIPLVGVNPVFALLLAAFVPGVIIRIDLTDAPSESAFKVQITLTHHTSTALPRNFSRRQVFLL